MDINITKQAVTSNKIIFEQTIEQAIDTDFTMPDYCPSIVRILKCKMIPRITSKNISNETLSVDGSAQITVIYADEENKICSYEYVVDFQKLLPVGETGDSPQIYISIYQDYVNCRAITQKKIDVHGVLSMKIKIVTPTPKDILTDIDCDGIQIKRGSYPATNPLGFAEKIVVIEEDLELSRSSGSIKSVLRSDARAVVEQCKLIGNKAVVKGELTINALYCTSEGKIEKYENRVPFNQIVDMNIEGDDCECDAEIKIMSSILKPRTNLSGEAKSFAFESKLSIIVLASCENEIPVIYDAFCTKNVLDTKIGSVQLKKLTAKLNERFMCKKTLEFSENTFGNVIDMWCENKVGQCKISNGQLTLNGTTLINLLIYDGDNQPQYYERSVDFQYNTPLKDVSGNSVAEAEIITSSCAYTVIDETKIETMVELCVSSQIYTVQEIDVIVGADINADAAKLSKRSPIIMYYANPGESIWDIAKSYNADCMDIINVNKLDDDILKNSSILLIP